MSGRIKDWKRFQHFKDRKPPWIKLYRDLLDDPEFHELEGEAAKGLMMLWLIASEGEGELPAVKKLAFRLRKSEDEVLRLLSRLSHWVIRDDITLTSERYQSDAPETETETQGETEAEKRAGARDLVFSGEVIKLNRKHFDQWTLAYKNLDLLAELVARDAWLQAAPSDDQKNWFISTSQHLANRNMKAKQGAQVIQLNDPYRGVLI